MLLSDLASSGNRWLANRVLHRWLALAPGRTVVSLTFDDVIESACRTGARLLEQRGCTGTFYVAGSLGGGYEDGKPAHTADDLARLHANGHELGCHTWSHRRMSGPRQPDWQADLARNACLLESITGTPPANFAYPFGVYDFKAKRRSLRRFASCRRTGGPAHSGRADLGALNSYRLYGTGTAPGAWRQALASVASGGWLIFNTHAVEENPGAYGCTPQVLEQLLSECQARNYRILNIADALDFWRTA